MKEIKEIVKSLEEWQREDGPAKRTYLLFCVGGIDGDECTTAVSGDTIDVVASISQAMLSDKRMECLIKGATRVFSIKRKLDKKKKDGTDTRN